MKTLNYHNLESSVLDRLKCDYMSIFEPDIDDEKDEDGRVVKEGMQRRWEAWKAKHDPTDTIKETVRELLMAGFDKLVDVYERFLNLGIKLEDPNDGRKRNPDLKLLDTIFRYTKNYDSKIADFFMKNAGLLKITTCYYCEMAYINTYHVKSDTDKYETLRQFDLDHFLPKSYCPCIGLSLFNFVPSCQICNSRIKLDNLPSDTYANYTKYSPSSKDADFDKNITIRLRPRPANGKLLGEHYIHFRTNPPYDEYVQFFHLRERYDFHQHEAVRLNQLRQRYPESKIKSIAKVLGYSNVQVKEDLFHLRYLKENGRCFEKMTRDILKDETTNGNKE